MSINFDSALIERAIVLARELQERVNALQTPAERRQQASRFPWRDAEKCGVDLVCVLHKPAPTRDHAAGRGGVGMIKARGVPARRRHLRDGIHAVAQQFPPPAGRV